MATFEASPPTTGVPKCTHHPSNSKEAKQAPVAKTACIACSRYLCAKCDADAHSSPATSSHKRFPVSSLRSFIVFEKGATPGESHIHRSLKAQNGPRVVLFQGCSTLHELFQRSVRLYPTRPFLGQRSAGPNGKAGKYTWQTYAQVGERAKHFGAGLAALVPEPKARVGLYSANRPEWIIAEQACHGQSLITVPLYDTLGADAAEQVMKSAGVSVVVCQKDKVATLFEVYNRGGCPDLKTVVVMPAQPFDKPDTKQAPQPPAGLRVLSFAEVEQQGQAHPVPFRPPQANDLFTLCYTSGTTGTPKGAMLSHTNLISDTAAAMEHGISATPNDVHLSYLPLAHVFERLNCGLIMGCGAAYGFSQGDTTLILDDVEALQPTLFPGVPRLYNRVYDKVLSQVEAGGAVKKWLFQTALQTKQANLLANGSLDHALWDRLVFRKVKAKLGGRVRLMTTGSAPIGDNVMTFLRCAFASNVVEGYGQTESTAASTITLLDEQQKIGHVGVPLACNEIKLVDVPEMGYTSKDVINGVPSPRGEIWVRGANVFQGYWKEKEKTDEALTADGWLRSGDIGLWRPDGTLKIIDRKKAIFKLAQGEYVAPEKVENALGRSKYVAQIFVYGDSLRSQLVAVVVPDEETLREWAKSKKLEGKTFAELVQHPTVLPLIKADIEATAKDAKLHGFEIPRAFYLHDQLFSPENNLLTPTFKLKRDIARKVFEKQITDMYNELDSAERVKPIKSKL